MHARRERHRSGSYLRGRGDGGRDLSNHQVESNSLTARGHPAPVSQAVDHEDLLRRSRWIQEQAAKNTSGTPNQSSYQ